MSGSDNLWQVLLSAGVAGAVLVAVIRGYLVAKPSVDDLRKRADEGAELLKVMVHDVLPVLTRAVFLLERLEPVLREMAPDDESARGTPPALPRDGRR